MQIHVASAALIVSTLLLSGCATAINGSKQKVPITSQPAGASVKINDVNSGVTPTTVILTRKTSHRVEVLLNGYQPYEVTLEPKFNGAMMGNILFGGIIGMGVDSSTGAGNTLRPDKVNAVLEKQAGGLRR